MKKSRKRRVIISVTNDLSTDQRVKKVCESLLKLDIEILLVGRNLRDSKNIKRPYKCIRMNLLFNKGALFYAEYNLRLFLILLFSKVDVYHSNDLDTLLANYLASILRRKPIVYDSHEYFTGVPEIQNKTFVKKVWTTIENHIFPKLKHIFTVNQSIASLYEEQYAKKLKIIRNIPRKKTWTIDKSRQQLGLPENKKIIITQGAGINIDRGIEEALEAMQHLKDVCFVIIGNGDVIPKLKKRTFELNLEKSIIFKDKMPYEQMMQYTQHAELGLSLDKNTNINYRLSLPNKIFDYIHAGVPILASKIKEVEAVITKHRIGLFIENHEPKHIAQQIERALDENLKFKYQKNIKNASLQLNWENEEKNLVEVYKRIAK